MPKCENCKKETNRVYTFSKYEVCLKCRRKLRKKLRKKLRF